MSVRASAPPATTTASNSIERAVSKVRSTVRVRRPDFSLPPAGATIAGMTPALSSALVSLATPARSDSLSAMIATLRPFTGPGSVTTCDNAGDSVTSPGGLPLGVGSPSPRATCSHRSASTLASTPS